MGVAFGLLIQLSRGLSMSLFYEALNSRVPGDFRATVNSLVSLGVRATFIVTGPVLGYALDSLGMQTTLLILLLVFTPLMGVVVVPLLIRIQRERVHTEPGAAAAS
jgi:antibiotic biosynthesis monooxygenase (ABM) superfamily enzyme